MSRLFVWLFPLSVAICFATQVRPQSFDYGFKHLTTDNGLSHDFIHAIVKDKQGFLWFGTLNGLNRFDGFKFKVFKKIQNDSTSIPHNTIVDMVCDTAGYLWMATGGGICRYDPFTQKFKRIHIADTSSERAYHLNMDSSGNILVTLNRRFLIIDRKTLKIIFEKTFPPELIESRIFLTTKNRIWLVNRSAAYLMNLDTRKEKYIMGIDGAHREGSPGYVEGGVMYAYTDPGGRSWIGTWDKGLFYYNDSTGRAEFFSNKIPFIVSICADINYKDNNLLWLGGGFSGLTLLNTKTLQTYDVPKNLQQSWSHNGGRIHNYFRDSANGILWLATDFGIQKYDPGSSNFARKMLPTSGIIGQFPSVGSVMRDKTDPTGKTWWVCSWVGGLYKWNRETDEFTHYGHKQKTSELFDIEQDNDGNIWIAEYGGLQIFHPQRGDWKHIDSFIRNDTVSTKVLRLFKDSRGNIWFAQNYDGFFKYDWKKKVIIRQQLSSVLQKKEKNWITGITEDRDGSIWVISSLRTFSIDTAGEISALLFKHNSGLQFRSTGGFGIAADKKDDILWMTKDDKLIKFRKDGTILKVYGQEDGIMSNWVKSILIDPQGWIWITSENSLHRFNPVTERFRYFRKEDGLFSNNIMEQISIADNGELFVGFNSAFSYTDTKKLNDRTVRVPFIFTYIQVEDRPISPINTSSVILEPNENTLMVEFAALDYSKPEQLQYAYWVQEGGNNQPKWNYTTQRSLTFTNLAAGRYILHFKVIGPSGTISNEELTLAIRVKPVFYRTWWFWLLMGFAVAGLFFLFYKIRREQKARLEKMRDRIATDLHDDMGSTLSSIRIFSDVLKKQVEEKQPQATPLLDKISNNAAQLSENMQDIIWTIKQDNDKLEDLVTRMREFGLKLCDAKDIEFKVHISDTFRTSRLDLEQRRNLYMIFKESLNNAIKYSGCDTIQLFITQQGRHLKMVIEDNGKGFDGKYVKKGNGLSNIQKRAGEINGFAKIESGNGSGTRIDVLIKLA